MAETFRIIPTTDFLRIRDAEIGILSHLRGDRVFLHDDVGDLVFDEDNRPIVDPTVMVEPQPLVIPERNMFASMLNGKGLTDLIDPETIDNYDDVFGIDRQLLGERYYGYHVQVLGYFIDNVYQGCVWYFTSERRPGYIGLYGIRASVANTLLGVRGIARRILTFVIQGGIPNVSTIVIPWPLDPMPILLQRLGFTRHDEDYDDYFNPVNDIQRFLQPIAPTVEYYTLDL